MNRTRPRPGTDDPAPENRGRRRSDRAAPREPGDGEGPEATSAPPAQSHLGRAVGVFVGLVVLSGAGLLWSVVWFNEPETVGDIKDGVVLGYWNVLYDNAAPATAAMVASLLLAFLGAVGIAWAERRVHDRSRRSGDGEKRPLAPKVVMAANRGVYAGPITITTLVPAHNEEASLGATLESLKAQTRPPERIIVVADNCTDDTVAVARDHGAEVFETVGNSDKKAGALNQALTVYLEGLDENDCVLVVDADTVLDPQFIEVGARRLTEDRAVMAVGGLFYGDGVSGLLGQFQQSEYLRYSRELERRRGRVYVLTGTASIFRPAALRTVAEQRGVLLPGNPGEVYDTEALTEDNELTLAIKTLGGLMVSPKECRVVTELMPRWSHLWNQRLRWQRGALENLGAYGFRPILVRYWAQQLGIGYSVIALSAFWTLLAITILATPEWVWFPFWIGIGLVFVVDRVVSVWRGGWKARILAAALLPELAYDMFLDVVYVKGILDITFARRADWHHVEHEADEPRPVQVGNVEPEPAT